MYSSRLNSRRVGGSAVALRVPVEVNRNAKEGMHGCSKTVEGKGDLQESTEPALSNDGTGNSEKEGEIEEDVTTQLGAALKDFDQVLPFSAFGRFFQQAKTQVLDVAKSPAVKFVGSVVTQINDVTEHMDQRMDEFLTGIVLPREGDENAACGSPKQLPVSNPSAPILECLSEQARDVQKSPNIGYWGDFGFDDDSDSIDQPVSQQPDIVPPQRQENMLCLTTDEIGVTDTAAQRSPLHPNTPHTPALGSPENMAHILIDQTEKPLHESLHSLLRQDSKENAMSQDELVERCAVLAEQSLAFQQQCQTLMAENSRLQDEHKNEGDAVMAEQLAIQVQHLMQEKARILQEKDWLEKENGNLQQLLEYACASMGRASSPGEGGADASSSPGETESTLVLTDS